MLVAVTLWSEVSHMTLIGPNQVLAYKLKARSFGNLNSLVILISANLSLKRTQRCT